MFLTIIVPLIQSNLTYEFYKYLISSIYILLYINICPLKGSTSWTTEQHNTNIKFTGQTCARSPDPKQNKMAESMFNMLLQ